MQEVCACLATFSQEPSSGLFTLHTASPQVFASGQVDVLCTCRSLTHPSILWHHRLSHPSLPRPLHMARQRLVSGLPLSLPPLPPLPALSCTPWVQGRQRATPHSSLALATVPLQTLHMDVWGPAPVFGPGRKSYFLVVVDEYSRYTIVFPLHWKADVPNALIPWIVATRVQRGLPLRLWPRVSCPLDSPTRLWAGSLGVTYAFCVWGCLAHVRNPRADKLSACSLPSVFLGFLADALDFQLYHPSTHRFFDSWEVNFEESTSFYVRFSHRGLPVPPPPLFLVPTAPPSPAPLVLPTHPGPAPSGVSHATPPPSAAPPVSSPSPQSPTLSSHSPQVLVDPGGVDASCAGSADNKAGGAGSGGADAGGTGFGGADTGGAGSWGANTGGDGAGGVGAGVVGAGADGVGGTTSGEP
ncbi:unnamed protein product [Closterium sp. NIES-54]